MSQSSSQVAIASASITETLYTVVLDTDNGPVGPNYPCPSEVLTGVKPDHVVGFLPVCGDLVTNVKVAFSTNANGDVVVWTDNYAVPNPVYSTVYVWVRN